MGHPLTILCDMDGILVDLFRYWLDQIEADHGVKVEPKEITRWDMHRCGRLADLGAKVVYGYLRKPGFFRNAPALPGALEGMKKLHDLGHRIVIVTSPSGPISAKEKLEWLAEKAPWINEKDIMIASAKTLVKGDVFIDDHPDTIVRYHAEWPSAICLGIRYPYNEQVECDGRFLQMVDSYRNTAAAWETIVSYLTRINEWSEGEI